MAEKVLPYPRDQVTQDTFYNCGPASTQTILWSRGPLISEAELGRKLGTHTGGTNSIRQFPDVLNEYLPDAHYISVEMPHDPPLPDQVERLWRDITSSINAGYGVVGNIVAPPSNYPKAVLPSTTSPSYGGGDVYHYIALMGYSDEGGFRRIWVADSGFWPYGYWIGFDQLASLIPPKGYAYSTALTDAPSPQPEPPRKPMGLTLDDFAEAMGQSVSIDRYRQLYPAFVTAMLEAECTNVNRAAMWFAQLGHESVGLKYMEEIASGADYEGRQDLGNTYPGDGRRYKGRGPIQITGRSNYGGVSQWASGKGLVPSPTYFVENPEELASDRFGFVGPVWYWTVARRDINSLCDAGDLEGVTRQINGGLNGLPDRRARWNRCLAMGERLLPNLGEVIMSFADDELSKKFPSRSIYRSTGDPIDTVAGFISNMDARAHEADVERRALAGDENAIALVKKVADQGIVGKTDGFDGGNHDALVANSKAQAQAILNKIGK